MCPDDTINQLLQELSDAKTWPERLQLLLDNGSDVGDEIREAEERIETMERRAKELIKRLGCVSPQTRAISQGMADMLINWHTFKDRLGPDIS